MHTFRKLPNSSPTRNPTSSNTKGKVTPEVYDLRILESRMRPNSCSYPW
jgi:hypothetical protein